MIDTPGETLVNASDMPLSSGPKAANVAIRGRERNCGAAGRKDQAVTATGDSRAVGAANIGEDSG